MMMTQLFTTHFGRGSNQIKNGLRSYILYDVTKMKFKNCTKIHIANFNKQ